MSRDGRFESLTFEPFESCEIWNGSNPVSKKKLRFEPFESYEVRYKGSIKKFIAGSHVECLNVLHCNINKLDFWSLLFCHFVCLFTFAVIFLFRLVLECYTLIWCISEVVRVRIRQKSSDSNSDLTKNVRKVRQKRFGFGFEFEKKVRGSGSIKKVR